MNAPVLTLRTSPRAAPPRARRLVFDPVLLLVSGALLLLGLVMVTSASISIADRQMQEPLYFLQRQAIGVVLGVLAAGVMLAVPTDVWERLAMPLLLLAFALLLIVLIPGVGHAVNGSRRWLSLGLLNFQVSELARVLLLTYLASYAARRQVELRTQLGGFLKPLGLLAGAAVLLLLEPDFGAATVLLASGLAVLFLAGVRLRHFLALAALAGMLLALVAVISPYRLKRLIAFLDPWADPFNSGFQLTQSLIAVGRGELFGVGLGSSVQKLFYLPEAHTDFVFAVLAEELGLLGVLVTLALLLVLSWRALLVARTASQAGMPFQSYCAAGFGIWLGLQSFINIGVNLGLLPTKGLTLPLMSYGGSSILVTLGWLGLVLRIHHEASVGTRTALKREHLDRKPRRMLGDPT
jgi:cell division protein FtsW